MTSKEERPLKATGFGMAMLAAVVSAAILHPSGKAEAQDSFNGYPCTEDCSGHQAGYDWAQQNGIISSGDCGGNSQSFIEGCQAYTEENADPDSQDNSNEDTDEEPNDEDNSE